MALKDLIADTDKLAEFAIEQIVREYVRYDPSHSRIVLTPAGFALSNDARVLVMLVAINGWKYIVEEVPVTATSPASLEKMTGIAGGTLRPVLKRLKDSHLVAVVDDKYTIQAANLDSIARVVAGEKRISAQPKSTRSRRPLTAKNDHFEDRSQSRVESKPKKQGQKIGVPVSASLARLVREEFFSEEKTLGQVVSRLHEMAIIAKITSLSGPIADLVRDGKLTRKKVIQAGKEKWGYRSM